MDARVVEGTGLENRRRFAPSAGSNPAPSALFIGLMGPFLCYLLGFVRKVMKKSFRIFSSKLFISISVFFVSAASALGLGHEEREGKLAKVVHGVSTQALRPLVGGSVPNPLEEPTPGSLYRVGTTTVTWRSKVGKSYSALVYHPTTPPVNGGKFPLLVYSHGLGVSAEAFAYLGNAWASRGVVSLFIRHPETDESLWRGKVRPMATLKEAYKIYWSGRDRAVAITSAIDYVFSVHSFPGPLGCDVDLENIAVAGNDLGALAALLVAGQLPPDNGASLYDSRVSAVLVMSPPVFCEANQGESVYQGVKVPVMVITGTEDDGVVGVTKAYQRRIPFDSIQGVDRYLIVLKGGDHRVYGGRKLTQQNSDSLFQASIRILSSDFLSAYAQGECAYLSTLRERGSVRPLENVVVEKKIVPLEE